MVGRVVRQMSGALLATVLLGFTASPAAHPLHTSLTEISYVQPTSTITVQVRVFAQDMDSVLNRGSRRSVASDSAIFGYFNRHLALSDERSRVVVLVPCGIRREGDALFACVRARHAASIATLTMRNELLLDLFDDQINIVQVKSGSSRRSLLFTKSAVRKRLG